jgi:hypothetical protein
MTGSRTASLRDRVRCGPSIIKQLPGIHSGLVEGVTRYTVFERKVSAPSRSALRAQLQIPENLFHLLQNAA